MRTPILEISELTVSYSTTHGPLDAVKAANWSVGQGEVVAIVGESGSGKSTTARAVIGLLAGNARITSGSVRFEGLDLTKITEKKMRGIRGSRIGFVPQDPVTSFNPTMKIGAQIAEILRVHLKLDRKQADERAVQILTDAGLTLPALRAKQYPHELSGGMRQRVLIGMAMACNPALIVADEPTSALDVTVQKRILDHLDRIVENGTSMILVTHDLGVAVDRADRIVVMQKGIAVEEGRAEQIIRDPQHEYTRKLVGAAPSLASSRLLARVASGTAPVPVAATSSERPVVLEARNLVLSFGKGSAQSRAVDDVSFQLRAGETLALVGESGAGKTTVSRIAAKLAAPDEGSIDFLGRDITGLGGSALRKVRTQLQYVYQNPFASLNPRFTVGGILGEALRVVGYDRRLTRDRRILDLLEQVALPPRTAWRKPAELSGGQQQRVAIARALAVRPKVMVLDEPVSALDVSVQSEILQLLVDLQDETGIGYLFVTHDLAVVRQVADQVIVMNNGRVVEQGQTQDVLLAPKDPYTMSLIEAIPGKGTTRRSTAAELIAV